MSEEKTKKCRSYKAPLVILVLFILFTLYVAFFLTANTTNKNGVDIDVNTEASIENSINENQEKIGEEKENNISYFFDENKTALQTVFSGLLNYGEENNIEVKYNDSEYGVFVESLNGINDENDEKFWLYYVNGSLGDVAADRKILEEGDSVEWRFEKMPF